jgi:hypothetical protein
MRSRVETPLGTGLPPLRSAFTPRERRQTLRLELQRLGCWVSDYRQTPEGAEGKLTIIASGAPVAICFEVAQVLDDHRLRQARAGGWIYLVAEASAAAQVLAEAAHDITRRLNGR